jgi:hypothetical protein
MRKILLSTLLLLLSGCASNELLKDPSRFTSHKCSVQFKNARDGDTEAQLDAVSELFQMHCDREVIALASFVRDQGRDKFYSVSSEMLEVLTPEGSLSPYTLESYERSFLSLLMAFSYLNLQKTDEAMVELRRATSEENAVLYNHGQDPIISFLIAAAWDRFDPGNARPEWLKLSHLSDDNAQAGLDNETMEFAKKRVAEIDIDSHTPSRWKVYGVGRLPELDWHAQFFNSQPYRIEPTTPFPEVCSSKESLMISTRSWTQKIAAKYKSIYHPLLVAKSLIRLPIGIGYGLVAMSTGAALGVGGCLLASDAGNNSGPLCEASMKAGGYVIGKSADLVSYTLKPDMRHWKNLPQAILISRKDPETAAVDCTDRYASTDLQKFLE